MDFKSYCKTYFTDIILKHFFDFKGRAGRKTFWLFTLNLFIINFALSYILNNLKTLGVIIAIIYSIVILLPNLGLYVRRLHDINFRGWWILLWLIPVIGFIALLVFVCLPGTEGENRFGPVPTNDVVITE